MVTRSSSAEDTHSETPRAYSRVLGRGEEQAVHIGQGRGRAESPQQLWQNSLALVNTSRLPSVNTEPSCASRTRK